MKYKTIGAFKNVQNVPYCKAASDMKVGMGGSCCKDSNSSCIRGRCKEGRIHRYQYQ